MFAELYNREHYTKFTGTILQSFFIHSFIFVLLILTGV